MKLIVEGAAYGARYEKEWKGDDAFKAERHFSIIFEYLWQYKKELEDRRLTEKAQWKTDIMMAKICNIEEILTEHQDLTLFFQESATAL